MSGLAILAAALTSLTPAEVASLTPTQVASLTPTQAASLTPTQAERAEALAGRLRCVVCQNQSVADSDAPLAADMRDFLSARIASGETDSEVTEQLVSRYGEYVLLEPRKSGRNLVLWAGPVVALLIGSAAFAWLARRGADLPYGEDDAEQHDEA